MRWRRVMLALTVVEVVGALTMSNKILGLAAEFGLSSLADITGALDIGRILANLLG